MDCQKRNMYVTFVSTLFEGGYVAFYRFEGVGGGFYVLLVGIPF